MALAVAAGCGDGATKSEEPEATLGAPAPESPARTTRQAEPPPESPPPPARDPEPGAQRPPITSRPIPFDAQRLEDTAAYTERHYGERETRLDPKVIVQHFSVIPTADGVVEAFSANEPDSELNELPGLCTHFVVDRDGTILALVSLRLICRHTVGLNDVSIGIEHVGASDSEVLGNDAQLTASLKLTAWLRCRYAIAVDDVIGHAESLSSPHHHELVPELQDQTHDDFQPETMERYRRQLAKRRC